MGPSAQQYLTLQIVPPPYPPTLSFSHYRDWYLGKQNVAKKTVQMNNNDHFEYSHFSLIQIIILLMSCSRSGTLTTALISTTTAPLIDTDQLVHQVVAAKILFESVGLENYTTISKNVEKSWRGPIEKSYFIYLLDTPLPQWVTKRH
jgi:hypothetical protein